MFDEIRMAVLKQMHDEDVANAQALLKNAYRKVERLERELEKAKEDAEQTEINIANGKFYNEISDQLAFKDVIKGAK